MAAELSATMSRLPSGWQGQYFEIVGSTQDVARQAATAGAPSRSIFVADFQSTGRGRQGRHWAAAAGTALLVSILLREDGTTPRPWRSTALASVALAEAIEAVTALRPAVKWPNDLLLESRKVAGILAESWIDRGQLAIAVGVGVNVNTPADALAQIATPATSLLVASGQGADRGALLVTFIERLDAWLDRSEEALRQAWHARLWGRGQRLRLADLGSDEEEVVVLGATLDGALRVRFSDGTERVTTTGELIL